VQIRSDLFQANTIQIDGGAGIGSDEGDDFTTVGPGKDYLIVKYSSINSDFVSGVVFDGLNLVVFNK